MTSQRDWRGLLYVAPFLLLYSIILIFPLLGGMWLNLNQVDLFGKRSFFGPGNYSSTAQRSGFRSSLLHTFEGPLNNGPPP